MIKIILFSTVITLITVQNVSIDINVQRHLNFISFLLRRLNIYSEIKDLDIDEILNVSIFCKITFDIIKIKPGFLKGVITILHYLFLCERVET